MRRPALQEKPTVRLAHCGPESRITTGFAAGNGERPALLVSYVYLRAFLKNRKHYAFRDWVLDSGAFSAHNSGIEIKLQDYIDRCKQLMAEDPQLTEIFALDVIGDWRAGLANCKEMWRQGIPAIPCYHPGRDEPLDVLAGLAKDYPKIAIGGLVGVKKQHKERLVGQCFARAWPCRIHGFGMSGEDMVMKYPFDSVDASNWEIGPCRYGFWRSFGLMSVRGTAQNLRTEVEWYIELERRARARWTRVWAKQKGLPPWPIRNVGGQFKKQTAGAPTVRLAVASGTTERVHKCLGSHPRGTNR